MAPPGPPPVTHHPYEEGEQRVFYVPYYHGQVRSYHLQPHYGNRPLVPAYDAWHGSPTTWYFRIGTFHAANALPSCHTTKRTA